MSDNSSLKIAKKSKNDEFYTQLADIEKELCHYKEHFKGKTVFCNCDDPFESNFFKYFALNFNHLGLKKLICTCYDNSPIAFTQLNMFGNNKKIKNNGRKAYKIEITEVKDLNGDGATDLADVKYLLQNKENALILLEENGDFRSQECIDLLKQADIVVTNPPFSLFREYVAQLMEYNKKLLIIGNKNAITYKEIFPLLRKDKLWLGFTQPSTFLNSNWELTKQVQGLCRWFTNLDITKRHENLNLFKFYNPDEYPKYDNYDAINVDKVNDIPCDYYNTMGVPITFLDKYNPDQFKIIGLLQSSDEQLAGIPILRNYNDFKEMRQDMSYTGCSGSKANGNPVLKGKAKKGNFLYNPQTKEYVHSAYARIVIRRIEQNADKID